MPDGIFDIDYALRCYQYYMPNGIDMSRKIA